MKCERCQKLIEQEAGWYVCDCGLSFVVVPRSPVTDEEISALPILPASFLVDGAA